MAKMGIITLVYLSSKKIIFLLLFIKPKKKEVYMSSLYMKYLEKKNIDKNKYYLFECGMFYIFIDDDAYKISKYVPFKITKLNENIVKCGFPKNSIDKYMGIFENLELDVEIINNNDRDVINDKIIKMIKDIDIDNISPLKAIEILYRFKELLNE